MKGAPGKTPTAAPAAADVAALRAQSVERLKVADKTLGELLKERLGLLDDYDKASAALEKATNPEPSAERQTAAAMRELQQLEEVIIASDKAPETLLPPSFRHSSGSVTSEMKDSLEATVNDLKEDKAKLEAAKNEIANAESVQKSARAERDKLFQRVANLKAKRAEYNAGLEGTQTAETRRLTSERFVNYEWAARVEALRLRAIEAQLALEAKLAHVRETKLSILQARVQIAEKALKLMRQRYSAAAENHERSLQQAAASEESKARAAQDPLESLRARRSAELLGLEAVVVKNEQALATSPSPSLHEQRALADRAEAEFAQIRLLLEDGRVSRLDAIRLNNDFRRIGLERDRLLRNEMPVVESRARYYEDALTTVELELLRDSQHDHFERDLLRERLPPSHWAMGEALLLESEQKRQALLVRRRAALEKLSERSGLTLQQVVRRLGILDEEYGFIRTHIFWVRDQDPIGLLTVTDAGREFKHLIKGLLRLAQETANLNRWGHPSGEFVATVLAALALPVGLLRLRSGLRVLVGRVLRETADAVEGQA